MKCLEKTEKNFAFWKKSRPLKSILPTRDFLRFLFFEFPMQKHFIL